MESLLALIAPALESPALSALELLPIKLTPLITDKATVFFPDECEPLASIAPPIPLDATFFSNKILAAAWL